MAQESWKARSGRAPGPEVSIEELLTEGYKAHEWMRTNAEFRSEPVERRYQKKRLALYLGRSRPAVNTYLQGGGVPFPFPPPEDLVWVVDVDDDSLRWVSPSLCVTLGRGQDGCIGRNAHEVLRGSHPTEAGHRDAIQALIRGQIDFHDCHTAFVRHPDHWLVPLKIRISYGRLYRVWFGRGQIDGQAFEPPAGNASKTRDHATDVLRLDGPPYAPPYTPGALPLFLERLVDQLLNPRATPSD